MQVLVASLTSELTLQWIKASSCLLVHREFKNPCLISIHGRVSELQTFVYIAAMKEFTHYRGTKELLCKRIAFLFFVIVRDQPRES